MLDPTHATVYYALYSVKIPVWLHQMPIPNVTHAHARARTHAKPYRIVFPLPSVPVSLVWLPSFYRLSPVRNAHVSLDLAGSAGLGFGEGLTIDYYYTRVKGTAVQYATVV